MAKRRRRPSSRPRTHPAHGSGTGTAERPGPARSPGPATGQRTRSEKKELARQQREAVRRQMARRERARRVIWIGGLALAVGIGVLLFTREEETPSQGSLPGVLETQAPWPANAAQAPERAAALGLPAEGTTMHEHANVQVFVHGEPEPVPEGIGITPADQGADVQSIHTHDTSGTVHLESERARAFTLGEFFGVWGVRLTPSCIGAYCNQGPNQIQVFVNGEEVTGDPREIELDDQDTIVITYGTEDERPDPIPSSFDFGSVPQ